MHQTVIVHPNITLMTMKYVRNVVINVMNVKMLTHVLYVLLMLTDILPKIVIV